MVIEIKIQWKVCKIKLKKSPENWKQNNDGKYDSNYRLTKEVPKLLKGLGERNSRDWRG